MISMKILDVKSFMSSLLIHSVFDDYLLCELDITTFSQFHVSGKLNKEWFTNDELEELEDYSNWIEIKPFAFQLMKGSKTPQFIKIVLQFQGKNTQKILDEMKLPFKKEDVNGLYLNVRYEHNELHIITGTSLRTFTLDKSLEHEWDSYVKNFLKENSISYEEI
ncbi:hypothetical protein EDD66_105114 [Mobilisporobacter senegalensis]|uniref:Uncharacterized protein n=1 Tax=Mobilisporobacter senegalensis TaxID=1329262 RepID=A0A3N1XNB8_9FIRM|nr:DUF5721 family protein [Mobilisporobacter senegalensis]ROR28175.1 hypothetical protein EDD66_105114 [Mobilisporobacter senegalensis]